MSSEPHTVLQHLLARRGKSVPVQDGRKIALVHFGGVMAGVRGAGALIALEELGLANTFDAMYVNSAGFPNVSYLLSGNSREGASIYYDDLRGRKFLNFFRLWGIANIHYMVQVMQKRKCLNVENIHTHRTQIWAAVRQIGGKRIDYIDAQQLSSPEYFQLMHAVTAVPWLHLTHATVHGKQYQDTYPYRTQHVGRAFGDGATDVLVICNLPEQQGEVPSDPRVHVLAPDPEWQFSRFCTKPEILKREAHRMGQKAKSAFGEPGDITLEYA